MSILPFKEDYDDLASRLHPSISSQQAQRSIKLLLKLGIIAPDSTGILRPVKDFVTTSGTDQAKAVRSYQKSTLKLAVGAIDTLPKEFRDISTLTVSVSRQCIESIRDRISEMRHEIIELIRKDKDLEEVYQINFQLFPLTRNSTKNKNP